LHKLNNNSYQIFYIFTIEITYEIYYYNLVGVVEGVYISPADGKYFSFVGFVYVWGNSKKYIFIDLLESGVYNQIN
jgi:hypothetical protein